MRPSNLHCSTESASSQTNEGSEIVKALNRALAAKSGFVRIPRSFLNDVMPHLGETELKCVLIGYLETIGRHRDTLTVATATPIPLAECFIAVTFLKH
jgi:hypothetical protein